MRTYVAPRRERCVPRAGDENWLPPEHEWFCWGRLSTQQGQEENSKERGLVTRWMRMDEERPSATSTLPHPECPSQPTPHKANKEQKGVAPSKPSFFSQLHLNNSASLAAQLVKNREILCNAVDLGLIPGLGRFAGEGKGYPTPAFWPGEFHGLYSGNLILSIQQNFPNEVVLFLKEMVGSHLWL